MKLYYLTFNSFPYFIGVYSKTKNLFTFRMLAQVKLNPQVAGRLYSQHDMDLNSQHIHWQDPPWTIVLHLSLMTITVEHFTVI